MNTILWDSLSESELRKVAENAVEELLLALADMFSQHCGIQDVLHSLPEGTMSDYCVSANESAAEILLNAGILEEHNYGYYRFTKKYNEMLRRH